jgi:glycosyltransferase involved in cell wall biosynthesis
MVSISVVISTYNQPRHLRRCLLSLEGQSHPGFHIIVADDGSSGDTRKVVEEFARASTRPVRHVWHEDRGFRKTQILNKAVLATQSDYLVFMDGDCVAHPDFVHEHAANARSGHYLNGSLIRLGPQISDRITEDVIRGGQAFQAGWLVRQGRHIDRRYLRLSLSHGLRARLNRASPTRLYWLGSNASCYRNDLVAINGFDNRFGYGFEDADFGKRLEMRGVTPKTVRWTAILLHLWHERPWANPDIQEANRKLMEESLALARSRAVHGLEEISSEL